MSRESITPKPTDERVAVFAGAIVRGESQSDSYREMHPASKKWKTDTVHVKASIFAKHGKVVDKVAELRKEMMERNRVDADYVLRRHMEIDEMDVADILNKDGSIRSIHDWPRVWRTTLSAIDINEIHNAGSERDIDTLIKKIKWPDKVRNLELLGKHIGVGAYVSAQKIDVTTAADLQREKAREYAQANFTPGDMVAAAVIAREQGISDVEAIWQIKARKEAGEVFKTPDVFQPKPHDEATVVSDNDNERPSDQIDEAPDVDFSTNPYTKDWD